MQNVSQTQLANIATIAGLVVLVANQTGFILDKDTVAFVIASLWSLGWTAYNYYQRYKKGDITLGGVRK